MMECVSLHDGRTVEATGYVRYERVVDGAERVVGPYCDACQADICAASRFRERRGEIRSLGAVPLDYRERLAEVAWQGRIRRAREAVSGERTTRATRIADLTRALMDEIGTPELSVPDYDPYPATVSEVADEIARFVLELEDGPARGVLHDVIDRLNGEYARRESAKRDARKVCKVGDHRDGRDTATVRVRYQLGPQDASQRWTADMCDRHGTLTYERYVREGRRNVEIMPAGWTPAGWIK